jgi:outer membrane receptor for ferrienterochelin and colicin
MDLPLLTRYSIFNRWNYGKENLAGWFTQLSFRATKENRIGGQRLFNLETDKGSSKVYGQTLEYFQPEFIAKTGYRFSAIHAVQSQISAFGQEQKSWFGTLQFKGKQQNLNVLVQHQWNLTESQTLTWGGSFKYQKLVEDISFSDTTPKRTFAGRYNTDLKVPGIFSEYSGKFLDEKITWIAGIRWDRHQTFGSYLTPRSMLKLDLFPNHTVRASVGTGWRQVNLFTENITLLASSRDLIFEEKLNPEKALNWGANYTCLLEREKVTGTFSIDFYQTRFTNQFFPDFESRRGKAIIRNFGGNSVSNGFQAETNLKINEIWEFKSVYNYVEVYREEAKGKFILPFNPTHRVMTALSYRPINGRIFIDLNAHWFGKQNLPSTRGENGELGPEFSKPFATFNGQVTWIWKNLEWYGGIENILDFRQRQPIVGWQNPFGPNFDTATVWGPTRGRELYMGIRWRMD